MNAGSYSGYIANDIELKQTPNGVSVCRFRVAVRRPNKKDTTDFIDFVAWRQTRRRSGSGRKRIPCILGRRAHVRRSFVGRSVAILIDAMEKIQRTYNKMPPLREAERADRTSSQLSRRRGNNRVVYMHNRRKWRLRLSVCGKSEGRSLVR